MYSVKDLCNKLNEANIPCTGWDEFGRDQTEIEWTPKNAQVKSFKNLPAENMGKLLEMDYSGFTAFRDLYLEWGRRGFLRFVPYMNEENENPTLTIRHNRHLHMFRGYHFQVSGTPNGIGSHEIGSYRTDFLLRHSYHDAELWSNSVLANMLCYAAMIDAAYVFDNFRDWFWNDTESMDAFLKKSMESFSMDMKYGWHDFDKYIKYDVNEWTDPDRTLYRVSSNKGTLCEFAFGVKTIQVRTAINGNQASILTIKVPDALEGVTDIESWDEDDLEEFKQKVTMPKINSNKDDRIDIKMLLIMAMALAGMRINFIACYCIQKCSVIKETNRPGIKEVENLEDIYECRPDQF